MMGTRLLHDRRQVDDIVVILHRHKSRHRPSSDKTAHRVGTASRKTTNKLQTNETLEQWTFSHLSVETTAVRTATRSRMRVSNCDSPI